MTAAELKAKLAEISADEAVAHAQTRRVLSAPHLAKTSELLALFVGLSIGASLGMASPVPGTEADRDHALGEVGDELDRRIPSAR